MNAQPAPSSFGCCGVSWRIWWRTLMRRLTLYQKYVIDFWQEESGIVGWREFPKWAAVPAYYLDLIRDR